MGEVQLCWEGVLRDLARWGFGGLGFWWLDLMGGDSNEVLERDMGSASEGIDGG